MRASFAGSDELAAQIRQGVKPDVFASANTKLPGGAASRRGWSRSRSCSRPTNSCSRWQPTARSAGSRTSTRPGTTIAMGAEARPGRRIHAQGARRAARRRSANAILANVRSNEPDVGGVVGKVATGAVDAGFVYITDVEAAGGELKAIELPSGPQAAGGVRCRRGEGRQARRAGPRVRGRAAARARARGARPRGLPAAARNVTGSALWRGADAASWRSWSCPSSRSSWTSGRRELLA